MTRTDPTIEAVRNANGAAIVSKGYASHYTRKGSDAWSFGFKSDPNVFQSHIVYTDEMIRVFCADADSSALIA